MPPNAPRACNAPSPHHPGVSDSRHGDKEREAVYCDADGAFEGGGAFERRLQADGELKAQNRKRHAEAHNDKQSNLFRYADRPLLAPNRQPRRRHKIDGESTYEQIRNLFRYCYREIVREGRHNKHGYKKDSSRYAV